MRAALGCKCRIHLSCIWWIVPNFGFPVQNWSKELQARLLITCWDVQYKNLLIMKHIAILRGINVGGKRKLLMADLRTLFADLGFENVATYIQSGNVIFEAIPGEDLRTMAARIASAINKKYGYDVPVIVFPGAELITAIEANPFVKNQSKDISAFHLTFLSDIPSQDKVEEISDLDFLPDQFDVIGRCVFIRLGGERKYHKSKLSNQFFEKKLGVAATTRNWKTVLKLVEMGGV